MKPEFSPLDVNTIPRSTGIVKGLHAVKAQGQGVGSVEAARVNERGIYFPLYLGGYPARTRIAAGGVGACR